MISLRYILWPFGIVMISSLSLSAQIYDQAGNSSIINVDSSALLTTDTSYAPFIVRSIYISGNKKTRSSIILRELGFEAGQHFALPALVNKFENASRQLINTALFHEAIISLKSLEGYQVDVSIVVKERWYIFPVPYFKIIDRHTLLMSSIRLSCLVENCNYGLAFVKEIIEKKNSSTHTFHQK